MTSPLVVVVTVCRNALINLRLTVESVQMQNYAELQHIVIDGGSSDGTPNYLRENARLFEVAISEPDNGIYDAMNKAIAYCPLDAWIVFLNAGDRFSDNNVLSGVSTLLSRQYDFIFGNVAIRKLEGLRVIKTRKRSRLEMPGCHQSTLIRAELLKRLKFDTSYKVGADFDFYLRAVRGGGRVVFFEEIIAEIAPEGFSAANEDILRKDYFCTISKNIGRVSAHRWLFARKLRQAIRSAISMITRR